MENFPSNAHKPKSVTPEKPKTDEPRVQRVVEGEVIRRKKSLGKRFMETFFGDTKGIGRAVLEEILIPTAREMVFEAGKDALDRALFPDARGIGHRRGSSRGGPTNYRALSGGIAAKAIAIRDDPRPALSRRARATHNFDEIILNSRREGEDILAQMFEVVERFDAVTVADLYEMVNIDANYTDRKFGWTGPMLSGAGVDRVKEGYLLDLPRPEALD